MTQSNTSPNSFMQQNERKSSRNRSPPRANAGQATTHALSRRLLGNEAVARNTCVSWNCLHQAGTWDVLQGPQLQRLRVAWREVLANHCRGSSAAAPRSELEVQRSDAEGTKGRQIGGRARVYEAPLCRGGRARLAPPYLLAMLQSGDDVEIRSVGRHGEYASATCTQARRARPTYRDGSAMGGRWPGQWQLMVTRFAEKRMEQMSAGACRLRVAASSYAQTAETTFRHSGD